MKNHASRYKDFIRGCLFLWAFAVVLVRCMTPETAVITLSGLFVEMLCYVLRRLHSSCVLTITSKKIIKGILNFNLIDYVIGYFIHG